MSANPARRATPPGRSDRSAVRRGLLALLAAALLAPAPATADDTADPLRSPRWPDIRQELGLAPLVFDRRVEVLAPATAEDPLNVPVSVRIADLPDVRLVLVIADLNPILKVLEFEPLKSAPRLSFRMKLQQGSPIRALARTGDGVWHAGGTWVETSGGGCTAPSLGRSAGNWAETLGQVDSRRFPQSTGHRLKLRVMHPMDTGLAPGIPAFHLEQLVLRDASGADWARLSTYEPISENPVFSVDFTEAPPALRLVGRDNNGNRIDSELGL
ncbi:MAG TPA: quinoprotein dehydrogenase-associated SoxYZ-like carrier [Rhodocyclaceae bacterium]|nr:quinoprotein dehydrogenase-associated SoxYZ-like carrier [Rhodocyclaceae bacterium]